MSEMLERARRLASSDGFHTTRLPQLRLVRATQAANRVHAVQEPSLCLVVQGAKEVSVAGRTYRYAAGEYLVCMVDLPLTGEVLEASPRQPYLCWAIGIDPALVYEVLQADPIESSQPAAQGIFVGRDDAPLSDAVLRLSRCLDDARDCAVLAPGILREIVYRLLRGPFGATVRDLGVAGSRTQRIARAIVRLKDAFSEPLRVEELAQLAGMSPSSFHEHFKRVTTLSPLQYQKQLRLHEARRLLELGATTAADVAFRTGYESASQFSREYTRYFGAPPMRDLRSRGEGRTA